MPTQQSRPGSARSLVSQLGKVAGRMATWKRQRIEIAADLQRIVRTADQMLQELGVAAEPDATARRKGGRPRGYRMSEATRAKLRAAWKRRKSAAKAGAR